MENHPKIILSWPSSAKNWLWFIFYVVGAMIGLCLSGMYLMYKTPFGKVTPSPISLNFIIVTLFFAIFLFQDVRNFVRQKRQSLTTLGRVCLWSGGLAIQAWDITAFSKHYLLFSFGALLIAVGCLLNLFELLQT